MSPTCRIYLYLDERAARFERDAELAAEPAAKPTPDEQLVAGSGGAS